MTTIFQLNYTFTNVPLSYKKNFLGRCDIKNLDIKECLISIDDIYDFNIVILSRSDDIFSLEGISNTFDIFISNENYPFLPSEFIKFFSSKISFIRKTSIITNTMINNYIMNNNENQSELVKSIIELKKIWKKLDEESEAMEQENNNSCNIM